MPRANRGPRLKLNEHGIYEIRWPEAGVTRRRSTGTSDFQFAQKILGNFLLLDARERSVLTRGEGPLLVGDAIGDPDVPGEDYWHEHVEPNVIDKASARYARDKLLIHFGHLAVRDIEPRDVDAYVTARRAGAIGRASVDHTISRELSVLNAAISHAVKAKRLPKAEQPFIKLPGTSEPRDRWLTEDEADALLAAAAEPQACAFGNVRAAEAGRLPRVYLFVALALATASRKTALLEMKWDQVDFASEIIALNPAGRAQTRKRRARVPISDELLPVLQRAYKERTGDIVLGHAGSIRTAFENAVTRAGLGSDVTPHVLRHTWATWAAQGGTSFFEIAGVLGDTIATVQRVYAHHAPGHLRAAVNNVRPSSRTKVELRIVA